MIKKFATLLLVVFLLQGRVFAQTTGLMKADAYFDYFQFKDAAAAYEEALPRLKSKDEAYALYRIAQCYMYMFQYKNAAEYFSRLVKLGDNKAEPMAYLDYGNVLKANGDYEHARDQFKYFLTLFKDDQYAQNLLKSVNWAIANKDSLRNYQVSPTDLDISGQCLGYAFFDQGLIYSHARYKKPLGSMPLFDLDYARMMDSTHFVADEKYLDDINFGANESAPVVNADGTVMYFSANATKVKEGGSVKKNAGVETSSDGVSNLKIYSASFLNGRFESPRELPFNDKEFNFTHPALSDDGITLFFASDKAGGFGGFDIYKVTKQADGKFGNPENLGPSVNTADNELYPYYNRGLLFFSSKGFNGYGGYDIYVVRMNKNTITGHVQNMGQPMNSYRDDVALITNDGGVTGYFSSNRGSDEGLDKVYFYIDKTIYKAPVTVASVAPVKKEPIVVTPPVAKHEVPKKVSEPTPKPAKKPKTETPKTTAVASAEPAQAPEEELLKQVFNKVYFKFSEAGLPHESYVTLDSVIVCMRANKHIRVSIVAHTDSRGTAAFNKALSEKRAGAAKKYLLSKGIPSSRIILHGYGESQLLNKCADGVECTDEEHAENRRVEIRLVK